MTLHELILSTESDKISLGKFDFDIEELRKDLNETKKFLDQILLKRLKTYYTRAI